MSVPAANLTEVPAEVGFAPSSAPNVCAFFGCSSKGPLTQATPFSKFKDLAAQFGTGPAVKGAAYCNAKTGANFVFIRLPVTAVAASIDPIDTSHITGTLVPTTSGTPKDSHVVTITFTAGGTVGTNGISYTVDFGNGPGAATPLGTATSFTVSLDGVAITVNLPSTETVNTGDYFQVVTHAPSPACLPATVTRATPGSPSTATFTPSGTPNDAYEVVLQVVDGGTVSTNGITVIYSLDGGYNFTPKIALGTNNSIALLDGVEPSGVTITFGAGTLVSGDKVTFKTTGPRWQASDAVAAMTQLRSSNLPFSFLAGFGSVDASKAGSVGGTLAGWASGTKFSWAFLHARDQESYESQATWIASLIANFSTYADTRIAVGAGYARVTCPITGRYNRRPAMWPALARLIANDPQIDIGKKKLGPLSSDVSLYDTSNTLVEYDARINSALHDARFVTLRSYDDESGVFVTRGNLMGPANDIQRIAYRRVLNIAEEVYQKTLTDQLESEFRVWSAQEVKQSKLYKAGDIKEADALRIEREIKANLTNQIISTGYASAVSVKLNRTPVSLGSGQYKLLCAVKITGLAYIDQFAATIGYTNPQLDALINGSA